ncbi:hypothetical protein KIMH_08720 [Bombiscardovia apis]|uniref:MFS transporter n=2 Tax=Bombiscardovia apis TaxID=2932182 RepID=A0ABM8BCW1_9BIFI|nr:hypothetical protein KIMH_08720 [Bombiscardovia apis]
MMKDADGFGMGDFYGSGMMTLNGTYVALFWTRFCGLSIQSAQSILGTAAFISAISALFFGSFGDALFHFSAGRRFGRRHLMMLIVCPLILTGILIWIPGLPHWAYLVEFAIWIVTGQIFQTAYNSLPTEMTDDYKGRTKLSTTRTFIATLSGTALPLVGGAVLATRGEQASSYQIFAIGFTIAFALAVLYAWRHTWEMSPHQAGYGYLEEQSGHHDFWRHPVLIMARLAQVCRAYASTLRISAFRKHLAIYILVQTSMDVFGGSGGFNGLALWPGLA